VHTPTVCYAMLCALGEISIPTSITIVRIDYVMSFINVSFLKRRTSGIDPLFDPNFIRIQSPRHRGHIHIKCNTENISIFFTRFNVNNINV